MDHVCNFLPILFTQTIFWFLYIHSAFEEDLRITRTNYNPSNLCPTLYEVHELQSMGKKSFYNIKTNIWLFP